MGRTVLAEEKVEEYISSLYGACKWQIGLIVGQVSPQRDYVVHLARTPARPESSEQGGGGAVKVEAAEDVDDVWLVEHARQVSKMLIGGMDVIGTFAFGPPDMMANLIPKLRQAMYGIHRTVYHQPAAYIAADEHTDSRIILQICSKTKKITCRTAKASDLKCSVSPAELKFQSFLSRWHKLETSVDINVQINVPKRLERGAIQAQIVNGLQATLQDISGGLCTVNGVIRPDDQVLVPQATEKRQGKSGSAASKTGIVHQVEIFVQQGGRGGKSGQVACVSTYWLCGAVHCKACVSQKATVKDATQAVKYDVVRSILSRVEVLCDDIVDNFTGMRDEDVSKTWTLPKRVFVESASAPLSWCDYVFQDEALQDSADRMSQLLDLSAAESDLQSAEAFPDKIKVQSIVSELVSKAKLEDQLIHRASSESRPGNSYRNRLIGAVVGVLTAVIAAGVSFAWGE